jgi:hypothetical protein
MAVLRSSHNAGKTKPQPKSFKELIGPLSQRSKLAEPKYADSSKLLVAHVWRLWTRSVYFHLYCHRPSTLAEANDT